MEVGIKIVYLRVMGERGRRRRFWTTGGFLCCWIIVCSTGCHCGTANVKFISLNLETYLSKFWIVQFGAKEVFCVVGSSSVTDRHDRGTAHNRNSWWLDTFETSGETYWLRPLADSDYQTFLRISDDTSETRINRHFLRISEDTSETSDYQTFFKNIRGHLWNQTANLPGTK